MKDFGRVAKVVAVTGLAAELLTGCATTYCCSRTPGPKETSEHNAQALEVAVDAAAARLTTLIRTHSVTGQFNDHGIYDRIKDIVEARLDKPDVMFGKNECVKTKIAQATSWGLQAAMRGEAQTHPPGDRTMRATIFGNTWANITTMCGVTNPERYVGAVQKGWNQSAAILDSMNFTPTK